MNPAPHRSPVFPGVPQRSPREHVNRGRPSMRTASYGIRLPSEDKCMGAFC